MLHQFRMTEPLDRMVTQALQDHSAFEEFTSQFPGDPRTIPEELAGPLVGPMKGNVNSLLEVLTHHDSAIRVAALFLVRDYWPSLEELVPVCLNLAFKDSDPVVRGVAMDTIREKYYGWIDDPTGSLGEILWCWTDPAGKALASAIQTSARFRVRIHRAKREEWATLIGPLARDMLYDLAVAEAHLQDPNCDVRHVSLCMFVTEWHPTERASDIAERLLFRDPEQRVRKVALEVLTSFYTGTKDGRIGSLLANIVRNESEPVELRSAAYVGLFKVRGMPPEKWPAAVAAPKDFRFPDQVDWSFVSTFR